MAALLHATASTEVADFLGCCDDVARKGTQTLSLHAVCHRLNHLETEWTNVTSHSHLTVSARAQALQHYYDVYDVCARTVPLPQAVWDRWAAGITTAFAAADAVTASSSSSQLETLRVELSMKYWGLYCRVHWGCACAAKPRLAFAVEEARTAAAGVAAATAAEAPLVNGGGTRAAAHTVESLEKALAVPLHAFARLAADMSHLFGEYAVVGAVEREWLSEEVGLPLGTPGEAAVEALVRRSFKRDLHVPSAALAALMREYEQSEVEERKAKEVLAVGATTLRSPWMRAASTLHEHLVALRSSAATAGTTADSSSAVLYDEKAYTLLEEVVRELRRIPHSRGSLPALATLTHRLVEWGPSPPLPATGTSTTPSTTTADHHANSNGLSGSQTQFYLFLLHHWFAQYIASQHRWSVTDIFNAADDSDLWAFVLDRHAFCLRWALASWGPPSDTDTNSSASSTRREQDAQKAFIGETDAKIDKVRAIFYSLVHCLQLYRSSVVSFANPEKREVRLAVARTSTQEWMARVGVPVFCRGLLGDLLDATEEWEDTNRQPPRLQLWALQAEAELKIIMFDTMQLLSCPDNTTERLETLVQVTVDLAAAWDEGIKDKTGSGNVDSTNEGDTAESLFAPLVTLAARVVQRIRTTLQNALATAPELSSTDAELYQQMVESVKKLIGLAAAYVEPVELHALWDEHLFFVALPAPVSTTLHDGAATTTAMPPASFPAFVGYAFATRRTVGTPAAPNGGIDDIAWERRTAFQLRRRWQGGHGSGAAATAQPSPVPKKPRTE